MEMRYVTTFLIAGYVDLCCISNLSAILPIVIYGLPCMALTHTHGDFNASSQNQYVTDKHTAAPVT